MSHTKTFVKDHVLIIEFVETSILDQEQVDAIGRELFSIADQAHHRNILVDLERVHFLSSALIGVFIRFKMRCRKILAELKLCNASPDLVEMMEATKLNRVFDMYDSRQAALDAFKVFQ